MKVKIVVEVGSFNCVWEMQRWSTWNVGADWGTDDEDTDYAYVYQPREVSGWCRIWNGYAFKAAMRSIGLRKKENQNASEADG